MPRKPSYNIAAIRASLNETCPNCLATITPRERACLGDNTAACPHCKTAYATGPARGTLCAHGSQSSR